MPDGNLVGVAVRFTADRLGLTLTPDATRFENEQVNEGDIGIYEGGHATLGEDDWHIIRVGQLCCPCHRSQFEFLTDHELIMELERFNPWAGHADFVRPFDTGTRTALSRTLSRYRGSK